MAANYDDVLQQLRGAGLLVDSLVIGPRPGGKPWRCKVEGGGKERRGWYLLHEIPGRNGDALIVGTFGAYFGDDSGLRKVQLGKAEQLTDEQKESLRKRLIEDRRRTEREREAEMERAAQAAAKAWIACSPTGECEYLARKGVGSHGVRFSPSGAMAVPILDAAGKIHGLQIIRPAALSRAKRLRDKEYWPRGMSTKGHFHLIGLPTWIVIVCEGYATGASIYEATGLPVAIAFDAGNLAPVANALRKRYRAARILIAADDDVFGTCRGCDEKVILSLHPTNCPHCGQPHSRINTGVMRASAAALEIEGAWLAPVFADQDARAVAYEKRGSKLSDFNDLHAAEGLHVVRAQIEAKLTALRWSAPTRASAGAGVDGGAGKDKLKPIETVDELLERFALVYGKGGTVFDRWEHSLLSLGDMRDACVSKYIHRAWSEHPARSIVREREVGFDPAGEDREVTCNLWAGWPTTPRSGRCDKLLELLRYMCSGESKSEELYRWVLRWIAYPIRHPGAKMKTSLVLHGPQGTGKNMFFEALMSIYGQYGRVIDQAAIEDKFNDWASRKLFLIADEVVARSDLYHVKNKLKAFITGEWIRINPKQLQAYDERNHVNIVFLSNEAMPVVLEEDDRRYAVIWTPKKLPQDFYRELLRELDDGGAAALHDYLLHLDLGEFNEGTLPPATDAKRELINLSLDSTSRFFYALTGGEIDGVTARPATSEDVNELYRHWCNREGLRAAPKNKLSNALNRKHGVLNPVKWVDTLMARKQCRMLLLGNSEMPAGESESQWLGEQVAAFRDDLRRYTEGIRG